MTSVNLSAICVVFVLYLHVHFETVLKTCFISPQTTPALLCVVSGAVVVAVEDDPDDAEDMELQTLLRRRSDDFLLLLLARLGRAVWGRVASASVPGVAGNKSVSMV